VAHDLGLLLPILTGAIYLVDGHAHYSKLDDAQHTDFADLLDHLTTLKVGEHDV
jgi:zinc/manganese transport system ATP-binding protein